MLNLNTYVNIALKLYFHANKQVANLQLYQNGELAPVHHQLGI